jgi:hypothetical protein
MGQENLNKIYGHVKVVDQIGSATTLDKFDSGKTYSVAPAAAYEITLPTSPVVGWNATFIVVEAINNAVTIKSPTNFISTIVKSAAADVKVTVALATATVVADAPAGTRVDVICLDDGVTGGSSGAVVYALTAYIDA